MKSFCTQTLATLLLATASLTAFAQSPGGNAVPVTADNFVRAETDGYFGAVALKEGGFGKFHHNREVSPIDNQNVIRQNRDTLYSAAVFDLDAGPVTITLPAAGERFMSMQLINEDEYTPAVYYGGGSHTLTKEKIGTRYVLAAIRILVDPSGAQDLEQVHALQDAIKVSQKSPGRFEVPNWDPASQKQVWAVLYDTSWNGGVVSTAGNLVFEGTAMGDFNAYKADSGKRLAQFIQDFLTYSALETGGLRMQFDTGNINDCLSGVCRLWSNRFQEKGIALYFLANDKLPIFPFDAPKLERVISNLLENAFKFTPQAGTVWLHAEPYMWERRSASVPSGAERRRQNVSQPNSVKVSVSDTGPGIPAEFHLEVFDDFFRLPGTENEEGMGLGLAIARRLVQGMDGKIWVESDPGAGSKFSFLVPYKPAAAAGKGKSR